MTIREGLYYCNNNMGEISEEEGTLGRGREIPQPAKLHYKITIMYSVYFDVKNLESIQSSP